MTAAGLIALEQNAGCYFDFACLAFFVCDLTRGFVGLEFRDAARSALRALNAVRPTELLQVGNALLFRPECLLDVYQGESVSCHV